MKYFKLSIIPLMALCFNVAFAGPPECYKGRALFESREAFFERVEKYHAQDLVNNRKKVKAKFGECSDRLVILDYIFLITYHLSIYAQSDRERGVYGIKTEQYY